MKLIKKLKDWKNHLKANFTKDQSRMFVLFLDGFFPSEAIFGLFGFSYLNMFQNSEKYQKCRKIFFWSSIIIAMFLMILTMTNFIVIAGKLEKFAETFETFVFLGAYIFTSMKTVFLCYSKRLSLGKILDRLEQYFPHSNREQMQFGVIKYHKMMWNLYYIGVILYVYCWANYTGLALFSFCYNIFEFGDMKVELLTPIYFLWDPYQPLLYPIFFIFQAWTVMVLIAMLLATDIFMCSLICVTSMEFDVLAQKLALLDPESDENAEKKLFEIIDGYNELSDISNEIEKIFTMLLLANVFAGILYICLCVFFSFTPIRTYLVIKYLPVLPGVSIQLFFTCYYGELLQTSSLHVANGAYNSNWYGQNLKFRKMILLTMVKAQKPQVLTGCKFLEIGMPIFYWSLQTAHSYYSLLSGLYKG
ncbi:hypothetical protein PVAND_000826 [Polypedilum vanderplanki]|uniref:Odorant receptor n=1 Tax=Polypedilum vanderplanki TaxID=319348 RepID=A0A9J6BLD5_POLVA|nr:hypothetical protein PVAND_000826 [Polypedilum vanderplanki]